MRHLFGVTLGTGDYGHLTIDNSDMLLRLHHSLARYSNQGFEASHKVYQALSSRATNHHNLLTFCVYFNDKPGA